ncbi:MAG: MarR family winged helix-turn-helix transcriptional regulator [Syntrophales bacterium]|jgi:DNA-binding MarR family transcriptional regulator
MKKSVDRLSLVKSMSQQCIAVRIRLLNRIVTNIYDSALSPFGVKLNQISILVFVHLSGEVGYDALCRRLKMEKSTVSRNIERMKRKGWLKIVTVKEERRKLLRLTPAGEVLLGSVQEAWENAQEKARSLLGEEGTEALCNIANGIWKKDKARQNFL